MILMIKIYLPDQEWDMHMLKSLLEAKQDYLSHFFENLDIERTDKILQALIACKGTIFFTGIGKSALIGKKIAATIASTGTKSLYLSPIDALHGDIGLVSPDDIFILLSKSGETEELLNLIPHLQQRQAYLIAVASNPESRLVKACQLSINLPLKQELCPFDLAPTTSTTIQMIFGDLLAMAMMRAKKLTIEQYALNHPAGRIGKRASWKVQDLMLTGSAIPLCKSTDKVLSILVELSKKRCGCILITSQVGQLMTKSPKAIAPDLLLWEAMKIMEGKQHQITVLPVVTAEHKLLGIVKLHDIVQAGL
jgi:arabinose-5-phosphate isomerase